MKPAVCLQICLVLLLPVPALAQGHGAAGTPVAEIVAGHAAFADDATIHHAALGGSLRWYLSPRVSVGPEFVYLRGPGTDRDFVATGNVVFDVLTPRAGRRWTPFVVAGAGLFHHTERFGAQSFSSSEGAFTSGVGVRAALGDRWFVGGEWRVGWELHSRVNGIVGVRIGK
jgi:opacity protein-like surface antigen